MSDSKSPQENPEPDQAPAASAAGPASGAPVKGAPVKDGQGSAPSASAVQSVDGDTQPSTPVGSLKDLVARVKSLPGGRRSVWVAVAAVCVLAGTVGSVLGAQAVARNDATKARLAFSQSSAAIAATLKLAVQHQEDLVVSTSTFLAGDPKASPAEFHAWARWSGLERRFPELDDLGLVTLVRSSELAAFETRITGHAVKPAATGSARPTGGFAVVPASNHHYYCLAVAQLVRSSADAAPAGADYCALTSGPLLGKDTGLSSYEHVSAGQTEGLVVVAPVYRGNLTPASATGRVSAFVGWVREVLVPGVAFQQALQGHPGSAVRLRYRDGSSNVVFTSGTPQPGAQSGAFDLHNGWTVRTFGPAADAGTLANGDALVVLIGGILLSVLLGLLILVIGGLRPRSPARVRQPRGSSNVELYDALTGLPNSVLMLDRAGRLVARAGRQPGIVAGALFIDIDWVKDVNDKLGQGAGDQLVKIVAERLEGVVRAEDTVGRLGGDEFVVLVEAAARGVRLDSLAQRVIESLHQPVELKDFGPSFCLTASIGVAFGRYATAEDLFRDAQLAAKAAGKDRYTVFNANMRSVIEGRGVLEVELNAALQEKQLFLLYQPIYDLTSHKMEGLEAFMRWRHPTHGVLSPADFIPLAEETGLIVPLGRWALEEACNRAAAWNVAGHQLGVSVTVSATQLSREGFVTDVRRALQQSGVEPSLLTLEIAEGAVMRDVTAAGERLAEIKQLGVRIALDDFGSGYASHADLQRLPLDALKVDRSSLAPSDPDDYRSWLLETILVVGRDLSLTVIAKGVETYEQITTLQAMGCTLAQGVLLGKPVPADGVESLLDAGFPTADATSAGPVQ